MAKAAIALLRFSHNLGRAYEKAAKHYIRYLNGTRFQALQADGTSNKFEYFSDAAFADNPDDRMSSQGYLMQLFGLPIYQKVGRQDTVTTLSTEAELLALLSAAKEQQAMSRLFRDIELDLEESLQLLCDNVQTIRLLKEETARMHTKLKHVDIHRHWLRQEVQQQHIQLEQVPTNGMAADGLTKVLTRLKHSRFLDQLGMISLEGLIKDLEVQEDEQDEGAGAADAQADPNVQLTGQIYPFFEEQAKLILGIASPRGCVGMGLTIAPRYKTSGAMHESVCRMTPINHYVATDRGNCHLPSIVI